MTDSALPELDHVCSLLRTLEAFSGISTRDVSIQPLQTLPHSRVYRFQVVSPPASLILKLPGPADVVDLALRERAFYRQVAPHLPQGLVPKCVLASEHGAGCLLIEDLAATHRSITSPGEAEARCFVRALAALHGVTARERNLRAAWQQTAAGQRLGSIERRLAAFATSLPAFVSALTGDGARELAPLRPRLSELERGISEVLAAPPVIVHGDAHYANGLYPAYPRACLIDWGMPMLGFGEIDLAHAIAMNLSGTHRSRWQSELFSSYLEVAGSHGLENDPQTFRRRYELGVLYAFASPVSWWRSGAHRNLWGPALRNLLDAARDLGLVD